MRLVTGVARAVLEGALEGGVGTVVTDMVPTQALDTTVIVGDKVDSVIVDGAKNCSISDTSQTTGFTNRESWKSAQRSNAACNEAKKLLSSGKPPPKALGKYSGEYWNDIRHYCRDVSIARDGLLVVKSKPENISGNLTEYSYPL